MMKILLSLLAVMAIIITSVGVADAYHNSFLDEEGNTVRAQSGHVVCEDVECLNAIIVEQQAQLDLMNATLNIMNATINELTILHYTEDEEAPSVVEGITIQTDKAVYSIGETITISGTVDDDIITSIIIVTPENHLMSIMQLTPNNGQYLETYVISGAFGTGIFEIRVSQDSVNYSSVFYEVIE